MANEITIRQAINEDGENIRIFIADIWSSEYGFKVSETEYQDLFDIESYYSAPKGIFLVACFNQRIIGTIAAEFISINDIVLKRMFVNKKLRRNGVAQRLLDHLLKKLVCIKRDKGYRIFLSTKKDEAIAAKKFYTKNGFYRIKKAELPDNFSIFHLDDHFMVKDVQITNLVVRDATIKDKDLLNKVMFESKSYWGYSKKFMNKFISIFKITDDCLENSVTKIIYIDLRLVGYFSFIFTENIDLELDMFFLHPDFISKGYGRRMWGLCVSIASNLGFDSFFLVADRNANMFYERMGCFKTGEKPSPMGHYNNNIYRYSKSIPILK